MKKYFKKVYSGKENGRRRSSFDVTGGGEDCLTDDGLADSRPLFIAQKSSNVVCDEVKWKVSVVKRFMPSLFN